jgi:uncharacterized phiE125 gp8 family phage protein
VRYRSLTRAAQPVVEPVSLADAKTHLRVDTESDDDHILALITAAREWCENYTQRTFIHTQWTMTFDTFPWEIELPRPPVAVASGNTATTITYAMETGGTATLATSEYRVDRTSEPGVIRTVYAGTWPSHLLDRNSISVTWWGGYGEDGTKVPKVVRSAILMLVAYWYERRLAADQVAATAVPFGVSSMLDSIKWGDYR